MFGFVGSITSGEKNNTQLAYEQKGESAVVSNTVEFQRVKIHRTSLDKFIDDKVFFEDDEIIIVIEGVIYNFCDLEKKYKIKDRGLLLKEIYFESGLDAMADMLNGYFAGVFFDKRNNKLQLVCDHITYKPVWYCLSEGTLYFSTDIDWLYKTVAHNRGSLELDFDGAYCLLNYGYMLGDVTPVKGVKKLLAGHILEFDTQIKIREYYSIPVRVNDQKVAADYNVEDILCRIDDALRKSIERVYKKDDEYGYRHCATLSGGLDSRLVVFLAKDMGYETLCLTMGEANCQDIQISSEICDDLKLEHMVYELNNGLFLMDFDAAVIGNGGTILPSGFLHSYRLKSLVNLTECGAIHSGDLGDLILGGSLIGDINNQKIDLTKAMYASVFLDGFSEEFKNKEISRYQDQFHFNFYNRGLNSAGNGCIATQRYTECSSPFVDKDLMNVMFAVPYELLAGHKIYMEYLKRYLPKACQFVWTGTGCKPTDSKIKQTLKFCLRAFKFKVLHRADSMNPYEKWYNRNTELVELFNETYNNAAGSIKKNERLWCDLTSRFKSNRVMDKTLACSLIRLIEIYNLKV